MEERSHRNRRILAVAAATCISLACGTNYAYSAWAPQFAEKLQLSATQSNLIGAAGNVGMYASGIPLGYIVDRRGPHLNTVIGAFALAGGYYPLRGAYMTGPGSMSVSLLSFFSFMTGFGSCSAFQASIKTAALNWPLHRGTATAFPLAAFGLSAFFFTSISGVLFPNSTSSYLLLLTTGTFIMVFFPVFFMWVPHADVYHALATSEDVQPRVRRNSNVMQSWKISTEPDSKPAPAVDEMPEETVIHGQNSIAAETSSLLSEESGPGDVDEEAANSKLSSSHDRLHRVDISGFSLLPKADFWLLFIMLGILTGIGLMTINNIGNDANALWKAYDPNISKDSILRIQLLHVSIISCTSFVGRLLSGIGSDFLVKRLHVSRFWCIVTSSSIFGLAQFAALSVSDPHILWLVSGLSGLGYGALFGVYPALVADAFGVGGLSVNWGFMTIAPVIWGNIFNILYGSVFDAHSKVMPEGDMVCTEGLGCYKTAYFATAAASIVAIGGSLGAVYRDGRQMSKARELAHGERLD